MNKTLHIPYTPALDNLSLEEVANALEDGGARFSVESLNWPGEFPYRPLTVITAAHSGKFIYLDFLVRCNYLRAVHYTDNSPVSEDSCVEFFVSPGSSTEAYWAFELNCIGTINAAFCTRSNECAQLPGELLQKIGRYASVGNRPFQEVEGSFIWSVVMAIPLEILGVEYNGKPVSMRGNFNKCAEATSQPHYLSWAPIKTPAPDFHRPGFFGDIILD